MTEIGIEQARARLGDLANLAYHNGTTTVLTRNGRPLAQVSPVPGVRADVMDLLEAPIEPTTFPHPVDDRAGWRLARALLDTAAEIGHLGQATDRQIGHLIGIMTAIEYAFVPRPAAWHSFEAVSQQIEDALDWARGVDNDCRTHIAADGQ